MEKRLPKSPMFSPKSPALYESYKSGCAWGLLHLFDFRQNSGGKLISDKKHAIDDGNKQKRYNLHESDVVNSRKLVLKDIMEEEIAIEHHRKKKITASKGQNALSESEFQGVNSGENYKESQSVLADRENRPFLSQKRRNRVRKNTGGRKKDLLTEMSIKVHINEAVEEFINKKLINGKRNNSRDFIDALEVLNSNKELFIKLLQDPNSLLVKHIQELRESQEGKQRTQSLSENKLAECRARNQSRSELSDRIIVLKPNEDRSSHCHSQHSYYSSKNDGDKYRPTFFSLEHVKKKLRLAMKASSKGSKEGRNIESGNGRKADARQFKGNQSNIYVAPRNDLSEMLNGRNDAFSAAYELLPVLSPRRDWLNSYYCAKMGYFGYSSYPTFTGDNWRTLREMNKFLDSLLKKREAPPLPVSQKPDDILDSPLENQSLATSVNDYSSQQKAEQKKPAPFNEHVVVEDIASPLSTICQPGTPLDLKTNAQDKHGTLSDYIAAVLQVSCPDWDKLAMKCHVSDQILDPFLFDDIPTWPEIRFSDPRLMINYINDVLLELHQYHSKCYPWTPLLKPKPQNMVREVLKFIDWQLLSQKPQESWEQLIENDLRKSGTWIDTGNGAEDVVAEMVDGYLDELIVETILNLQI